ncbi:MAG TPA: response regulator transcription factor [Alphaproteobacteria bacterium]|nr:response regulator transcription factor [Alphaproteobacteria bacterium]
MAEASVEVMAAGKRVLVVDDDEFFRESLAQNLADAGFVVETAANGEEAIEHLAGGNEPPADLVILDWKMPGLTGIEVLRRVRQGGVETPVIFLTTLTDQIYEESALASGAVDFVEKSRSFVILLKRIELILNGVRGQAGGAAVSVTDEMVSLGELELNLKSHRALWDGREVPLTLSEFNIVHLMASRAGADVRYRDIYDLVRGEGFTAGVGPEGYRANVRTFIKRIRQKFREIDERFDSIENYPGFGYRWRKP